MTSRLLSWLGLLAVLGLLGAGVASLMLVKDRVRIVVQDDTGADPAVQRVAQLEDEVRQLHADVRALAEALGKGLQQLADSQAQDGEARQRELEQRLTGLASGAQGLAQELSAMRKQEAGAAQAIAGLAEAVRDAGRGSGAPSAAAPEVAAGNATPPTPPQRADGEAGQGSAATPDATPPEAPVATPTPRKRSAFAFQLPSQQFRFDLTQAFELIPSLSRVGFDAKSTMHDFTGVTSKLAGTLHMNLAAPAAGCSGEIRVDAASLDTGLAGRNDAMREHLATAEHKEIVFVLESMQDARVDAAANKCSATVRGKMTIRGQTRAIDMPVRLSVDEARRVHADGEVVLALTDYGVPVPSQLGMIKMQDQVKVWVALQARALGEATKR